MKVLMKSLHQYERQTCAHDDVLAAASQTSSDTTTSAGDENAAEERPAKKSKKGKKVQWPADDANLVKFHFFEMDEDERG